MVIPIKNNSLKISIASLIIVNLIPLFGVLFLSWNIFMVLFLYWTENLVIGFYTLLKMTQAPFIRVKDLPKHEEFGKHNSTSIKSKPGLITFFIIHFSIFSLAHLFFLNTLFGNSVKLLFTYNIALVLFCLFLSHGISFFTNFIGNKEYKRTDAVKIMTAPYKRLVVMHLTIIIGGIISKMFNYEGLMVVFLIILKIILDTISHIKEHRELV